MPNHGGGKMKNSFFYLDGFFLSWKDKSGESRVFVQCKKEAQTMFANLKNIHPDIELHKISEGKMKKVA